MSDPSDPSSAPGFFTSAHALVTAILASAGGFFLKRTIKQLDEKADKKALDEHKAEVDKKFADMQASLDRHINAQIQQHADNTTRLDNILMELTRRRD